MQADIPLALLDASIPQPVFQFWHARRHRRGLFAALAASFALIIPHSDIEVGRFRLLGATLPQMPGWCNDLSYACALSTPVANLWRPSARAVEQLEALLVDRAAWLVCNLPPSEEAALRVGTRRAAQRVCEPVDGVRASGRNTRARGGGGLRSVGRAARVCLRHAADTCASDRLR